MHTGFWLGNGEGENCVEDIHVEGKQNVMAKSVNLGS